jgi:hypothetical protein
VTPALQDAALAVEAAATCDGRATAADTTARAAATPSTAIDPIRFNIQSLLWDYACL